jgi:hypothetical protein
MKNLMFIPSIIICIVLAYSTVISKEAGSNRSADITLQATGGVHIPVIQSDNTWNPYGFGGFRLEIPSAIPKLAIIASADAGILESNTNPQISLKTLHIMLGYNYRIKMIGEMLLLKPCAGFSSVTINGHALKLSRKIFNNSESENGFFAGIEPVISIKRIRISVPVYGTYIFSSPDPFITISASLNAGAAF